MSRFVDLYKEGCLKNDYIIKTRSNLFKFSLEKFTVYT